MNEFEYLTNNINKKEKRMGDFYDIAERIFGRLRDSENGIRADEISHIVGDLNGKEINCYPGNPGGRCHDVALFVSLNSLSHADGTKHLKFRKALEKIVQHTEYICPDEVRAIVLLTDTWDVKAFDEWKGILEKISVSGRIYFEIYLLANKDILRIKV